MAEKGVYLTPTLITYAQMASQRWKHYLPPESQTKNTGIEHGNFIDPPTARLMAEKGVYLTPTLITYAQMASQRWKHYLPPESQTKNTALLKSGPLRAAQTHEFALRARVLSPLEVLRSVILNPARMMGWGECIGQVKQGFRADLVVLGRNPLEDVTVFDRPGECVGGVT